MKKNIKLISILVISLFMFQIHTYALTPQMSEYNLDYVIDKYDVRIIVNENNTFDITETITAYFNVEKHGIFRNIPLKNKITRLDGSTSKNRAQITNIDVNEKYTKSFKNNYLNLKIGDPYVTLTGEKTYVINYTYNIGKDPLKDMDELYFNIIGNEWDTVIGNITFTIIMPKEFDSSKLGFSSGAFGSTDNSNIQYDINGTTITGSYNGILDQNEAITIRCELPDSYFVNAGLQINYIKYIYFLIPIILAVIAYLIWKKYGKDKQVVETVEFYPPKDMNSLEAGWLYKGDTESSDVISLLIYLANKGYLKIVQTEHKYKVFLKEYTTETYKIIKLKEYDGTNENEQTFFNDLFSYAKDGKEVLMEDLYNKFYKTVEKIKRKQNKNKQLIFEKTSINKKWILVLMIIVSYISINIAPLLNDPNWIYGVYSFIASIIGFNIILYVVMTSIITGKYDEVKKGIYTVSSISITVILAPFIIYIIWKLLYPFILYEISTLICYTTGLISTFIITILWYLMEKRNEYGLEMLGKLKGFKTFLETAEKDRIEALVNDGPSYFYNILPYTYALNVSDKWVKKFESIAIEPPSWYDGTGDFNVNNFNESINSVISTAESSMSSSSSGSSGGGSSGGGSGGGGGGSW